MFRSFWRAFHYRAPLAKLAVTRLAWSRGKRLVSSPPQVAVISPGGVATTMLISHLSTFVQVNASDDSDGIKHLPRRPLNIRKVIYLTGSVDDIIRSLNRRSFADRQLAKLGSPIGLVLRGKSRDRQLAIAVRKQQHHFETDTRSTLVIAYDELWDEVPRIAEFLEIEPRAFARSFPPKRNRKLV